jgi:hypothetical protein
MLDHTTPDHDALNRFIAENALQNEWQAAQQTTI